MCVEKSEHRSHPSPHHAWIDSIPVQNLIYIRYLTLWFRMDGKKTRLQTTQLFPALSPHIHNQRQKSNIFNFVTFNTLPQIQPLQLRETNIFLPNITRFIDRAKGKCAGRSLNPQ